MRDISAAVRWCARCQQRMLYVRRTGYVLHEELPQTDIDLFICPSGETVVFYDAVRQRTITLTPEGVFEVYWKE